MNSYLNFLRGDDASQVIELYRLLAVGISLWNQFAVPVLFSAFWSVLFVVQLCSDAMSASATAGHQGILFFLLSWYNPVVAALWVPDALRACVPATLSNLVLFCCAAVSLNVAPHRTRCWA